MSYKCLVSLSREGREHYNKIKCQNLLSSYYKTHSGNFAMISFFNPNGHSLYSYTHVNENRIFVSTLNDPYVIVAL